VHGIPSRSVTSDGDHVVVSDGTSSLFFSPSSSPIISLTCIIPHIASVRDYTPIKVVGDGCFGTVWLVDWHGQLPPNTPVSAMQHNARARPEYANKRLVAVKKMKRQWSSWEECRQLKELQVGTVPRVGSRSAV
jgi:hypothetical protein